MKCIFDNILKSFLLSAFIYRCEGVCVAMQDDLPQQDNMIAQSITGKKRTRENDSTLITPGAASLEENKIESPQIEHIIEDIDVNLIRLDVLTGYCLEEFEKIFPIRLCDDQSKISNLIFKNMLLLKNESDRLNKEMEDYEKNIIFLQKTLKEFIGYQKNNIQSLIVCSFSQKAQNEIYYNTLAQLKDAKKKKDGLNIQLKIVDNEYDRINKKYEYTINDFKKLSGKIRRATFKHEVQRLINFY